MKTHAPQSHRQQQANSLRNSSGSELSTQPGGISLSPPTITFSTSPLPIQRFGTSEHRQIGDEATKSNTGAITTVALAPDYRITYGEMVALAGDFFKSLKQMKRLANKPGKGEGTREELEYARIVKVHGKYKTEKEQKKHFTKAAMKAVNKRYYGLAAKNVSHFMNPKQGDTKRPMIDKINDKTIKLFMKDAPVGALGHYRMYHCQAMKEAFLAGQKGVSIDAAMAAEAFGGHYLTDMFAAGHTRTARISATEYWNKKIPMFFYNFKGFLSEKLAKYINANNWRGVASVPYIFEEVWDTLGKKLKSQGMPDFTFGDLVSGAIHDYDNAKGLNVKIEGVDKKIFGDGNLKKGDTKKVVMDAVQAGVSEVNAAYLAGKGKGADFKATLKSMINTQGLFKPEQKLPQIKPDAELPENQKTINWKRGYYKDLLTDPKFYEGLRLFLDEKKEELAKVGKGLSEAYQRKAFENAILKKMDGHKGVQMIYDVINWTPDLGSGASGDADAKARGYLKAAKKKKGAIKTLTYIQRHNLMVDLLDGPTVGNDEDAIMEILKTAKKPVQKWLIKKFGWNNLHDEIDDGPGEHFKNTFPKSKFGK